VVFCAFLSLRKRIWQSRSNDHRRFSNAIIRGTGNIIFLAKDDRTVVFANKQLEKFTGYTLKEILKKKKWTEFLEPKSAVIIEKTIQDFKAKSFNFSAKREVKVITKEGQIKDVLLCIARNSSTGKSVISMHDFTRLKNRENKLAIGYNFARSLQNLMDLAVIHMDLKDKIVFINDKARILLDTAFTDEIYFKNFFNKDDWEKIEIKLHLLSSAKSKGFREKLEMFTSKGNKIFAEIYVFMYDEGKISCVFREISGSEEKIYGSEIDEEFLQDLFRDINNKTAKIYAALTEINESSLANKDKDIITQTKKLLEDLSSEAKTLLCFSPGLKNNKIVYDLEESLYLIVSIFSEIYKSENIQLKLDFSHNLLEIVANKLQIEDVLFVIINNAYKSVEKNTGVVEIKTFEKDNYVYISVKDNGQGFTEQEALEIFKESSPKKNGSRISFYEAYKIIDSYEGEITLESKKGQGSVFIIKFPLKFPGSVEKAKIGEIRGEKGNVIVIDDEEMIDDLIESVLADAGYKTDKCLTADQGIFMLDKNNYDVIFIDIRMPETSGVEVYEWIKQNKREFVQKIVFITGDICDENTNKFLTETGIKCLYKPFDIAELVNLVDSMISMPKNN
ncbi:response regulator, partial [bacterium]|nr:response regulator [bacterium]